MTPPRPVQRPSPEDVFDIVAAHAANRPVRTTQITGLCEAAFPAMQVTNDHVAAMLRRLARRDRVLSLSGEDDADRLVELGLPRPQDYEDRHARYWMLPSPERTSARPRIPHQSTVDSPVARPGGASGAWPYPPVTPGSFQLVPPADDGREEIKVSDDHDDAPDGAIVDVTTLDLGPLRTGWYQRSGDTWIPVADPTSKEHSS